MSSAPHGGGLRLADRPSLRALAGTLLGNLPGVLLPFLITARIEAGRLTDAYFYAFAIAIFGSAVVSLTLENNVVPVAAHYRRIGARRFGAFVRGLLVRSVAWSAIGYVVVGAIAAGTVLARDNWTPAEIKLCLELIGIFGLYLVAVAATSVISGCLYAFGSFFAPTLSTGIRSLLPVPVLFLTPPGPNALLLCAATLALGELLRALLLGRRLRSALAALPAEQAGRASLADPPSVWSTAMPYGAAMVLLGSTQLVDRMVAAGLKPGAITTLDLAEKVFYTPIKLLTASVLLVGGAHWAGTVLDRPAELAREFWSAVRRVAWLSGALAAAVALAMLVVLLTVDATIAGVDVRAFAVVLAILMVGFPAAVVTNAGVRLLTVLRRTRMFPAVAALSFGAGVAGSIAGAATLGVAGIALSGTIWRSANLVVFLCLSSGALSALAHARGAAGTPPGFAPGERATPSPLPIRTEFS